MAYRKSWKKKTDDSIKVEDIELDDSFNREEGEASFEEIYDEVTRVSNGRKSDDADMESFRPVSENYDDEFDEYDDELVDDEYDEGAPKKHSKLLLVIILIVLGVLIIGAYVGGVFYFKDRFQLNTFIQSREVSMMDADEANALFTKDKYTFTVIKVDGQETMDLDNIDYDISLKTSVEDMIASQNVFEWPLRLFSPQVFSDESVVSYDEDAFEAEIKKLDLFNSKKITKPKDAYLKKDKDGHYTIVEEVNGNKPKSKETIAAMKETLKSGLYEINLVEKDLYEKPAVTKDDVELQEQLKEYLSVGEEIITVDLKGATEVLSTEDVLKLVKRDGDNIDVDDEKLWEYVHKLADKYETYMKPRNFKTTSGTTIKVGGSILGGANGDTYGFIMDQEATFYVIRQAILDKKTQTVSAVWTMEGLTHDKENGDIGKTYIEISITEQHLWYYQEGKLVLDTDIITGLWSVAKRRSPEGVFRVLTKMNNVTLKGSMDGETWNTVVDYWIGVTWTAVGIHDASWQTNFGGNTYTYNGSHGCINVPYSKMQELFNAVALDTPIIIYSFFDDNVNAQGSHATVDYTIDEPYVEPETTTTETTTAPVTKPTEKPTEKPTATEPPETDPPETDPPETDPPETDPPETDPPETDPPETDPPETDPPETDPEP